MGTVAAPPESALSEKLPSGLVITHDDTPCVFQKMEVRAPMETLAGTAQMATLGSMVDTTGGAVTEDGDVCLITAGGAETADGAGVPT